MKHDFCAVHGNISLRPLHRCDIEKLRIWRNDRELNKFLNPIPEIKEEAQLKWYESYIVNTDRYLFSVIDNENAKVIGTIGIYNFNEAHSEAYIGQIIIGDETEHGKGIGYRASLLAACIGFRNLGLKSYRLNVFEENTMALNLYLKTGFQKLNSHKFGDIERIEYDMGITLEEFEDKNRILKEILMFRETAEDADRLENGVISECDLANHVLSGYGTRISEDAFIGAGTRIGDFCIIESGAIIGNDCIIESKAVIRSSARIGSDSYVGADCIIGEIQLGSVSAYGTLARPELVIGKGALLRSGTIIYEGSIIGDDFQTGHRVTIREKTIIGNHARIGTLSDIQGHCRIGNYVHMHSNVHIGMKSEIDNYVWIFPYVVLTNDPTPPSNNLKGVHISAFAIVSTGSVILPGVEVASDSLVGAGAIVTKNVAEYSVVAGNPAKVIADVRKIKNKETGEDIYPWKFYFDRDMPWEGIGYEKWENDY